ncbi:MAG: alpha/beta hydrolase-fold protein [Pusillimonas sp.]
MLRLSFFLKSFLLFLCGLLGAVQAQGTPSTHGRNNPLVGETIADRPSTLYRFEKHRIESADGKRRYRIEISVPRTPAPKTGYPVLYLLDGNAAMATLTEQDLAAISATNPPVLVALGYDVPTRNDAVSRAYDYTPPVYENGTLVAEPVVRGRVGGGADIFLQFITSRIKPLVRAHASIDPNREYLWGHSYGGLFTLHTLFTQPDAFARYITGDPSAWWYDGALMQTWHAFDKSRAAGKRIAILVGTKPRDAARPAPSSPASQKNGPPAKDPHAAVREIADGLRLGGAAASYETFPQYGHGDMIRVSLERALQIATEP